MRCFKTFYAFSKKKNLFLTIIMWISLFSISTISNIVLFNSNINIAISELLPWSQLYQPFKCQRRIFMFRKGPNTRFFSETHSGKGKMWPRWKKINPLIGDIQYTGNECVEIFFFASSRTRKNKGRRLKLI